MPIHVYWDSEATILIYHPTEDWTYPEWEDAIRRADRMIDGVPGDVPILYRLPPYFKLQPSFISHALGYLKKAHPRAKPQVIITHPGFIEMMLSTLSKLGRNFADHILIAHTEAEARQKIKDFQSKHPAHTSSVGGD